MPPEPAELTLRFQGEDLDAFARASGDHNPLHLDDEFAAESPFGGRVVHGALLVLGMLAALPAETVREVRGLRILFAGSVRLGESMSVTVAPAKAGWELRGRVRGKVAVRVQASTVTAPSRRPAARRGLDPSSPRPDQRAEPAAPDPALLVPGYTVEGHYTTAPALAALAARYGVSELSAPLLAGLAWSSYVVGMEVPGLRSLFAALTLTAEPGDGAGRGGFSLAVREGDARTGLLVLDATLATPGAAVHAVIECFAMPASPAPDPGLLERTGEPRATGTAVLIGASRGFGASLALALVGRGLDVHGTYVSSSRRAQALADLAASAGSGAGRLALTRCDARDAYALQELADGLPERLAGVVLGAAPPPVGMALQAATAEQLADYVRTSVLLAATPLGALLDRIDPERGWVLICSSTALEAPPRDWPHYLAAKGALEGLAGWLAATRPHLRTLLVRLPKMSTAMTGTPSGRIGAVSPDVLAVWTAARLVSEEAARGLTVLAPEVEPVAAS